MRFVKYLLFFCVFIFPLHAEFISSKQQKQFEQKYSSKVVERALNASENIWELKSDLGLTKHELFSLCLFIETKLSSHVKKGQLYLRKEKTKLARTIQYDPKTKRTFIHLKQHGIKRLGKGWHKVVTYSIMYSDKNPELVANSVLELDFDSRREVSILKRLKTQRGLAKTYSITTHAKKRSKKKVVSIIQKLYNAKSLHHYQQNPKILSREKVMHIAHDLLYGLEELHKHNLVHRDLHGGNILVERVKGGKYNAAIIDFGQTRRAKQAALYGPMVEVPKRFNPPDAFWRNVKTINAKAVDVYALGLNLYHLYFGVQPEWASKPAFAKISSLSDSGKVSFRNRLLSKISYYLKKRKNSITSNQDLYTRFERLILQMCHPKPYKRGSAREVRLKLDKILRDMN